MQEWLMSFFLHHQEFTYPLLFLFTIAEGTITPLVSGALVKIGFFHFLLAWGVGFLGECAHDTLFWWIGKRLKRLQKTQYFFFRLDAVEKTLSSFNASLPWYIFASKFTWHFNRVVLVSAGYLSLPYSRFIKASVPAAFFWVVVSMGIGYFFADQTGLFHQRIEIAGLLVGAGLILILFIQLFFSKIIRGILSFNTFIQQINNRKG